MQVRAFTRCRDPQEPPGMASLDSEVELCKAISHAGWCYQCHCCGGEM